MKLKKIQQLKISFISNLSFLQWGDHNAYTKMHELNYNFSFLDMLQAVNVIACVSKFWKS